MKNRLINTTQTGERSNMQDSSETLGELAKKETSMIAVNEMCRQQEKSASVGD